MLYRIDKDRKIYESFIQAYLNTILLNLDE
jgi:hypothetical protein